MRKPVTVVGGANMDIHATSVAAEYARGTSNPATIRMAPGGVARNIAESVARLGVPVRLLAAVGADIFGDEILASARAAGVDVEDVDRVQGISSGLYVTLLTPDGSVDTAAADTRVVEALDEAWAERHAGRIADSSLVVVEANLGKGTLARVISIANDAGIPVVADPVSVAKAERLAKAGGRVYVVTPDEAESTVLGGVRAAHTVMTLGAAGVRWTDHESGAHMHVRAPAVPVVDVTGAGDTLIAGLVAGLWSGAGVEDSLRLGVAAAAAVVGSLECTLAPEAAQRVKEQWKENQYE